VAALELRRRARGEDPHRLDVLVPGPHRARVHHGDVAEVRAVRGAQADREVALKPHVDRRLRLGEARRQRLREGDDGALHDERARLAAGVVREGLVHPVAGVPAADDPHVLSGRVVGLGDEGELRVERERDVPDEPAKELVPDGSGGALADRAQQIPAAEPRSGLIGVDGRWHEPAPRLRC